MAWACPDCPLCGNPPQAHFGGSQAFCGNNSCQCLSWERSRTQAQNLANLHEMSLEWEDDNGR